MCNGDTILFVDIDGPLLPFRLHYHPDNWELIQKKKANMHIPNAELFEIKRKLKFDPVMVHAINRWLDMTDGKIVFSTAWAEQFEKDQMLEIFRNNGIDVSSVHNQWMTPRCLQWDRGVEISHWLAMNKGTVKNYMVIDDDPSVLNAPGVRKQKVLLIDLVNGLQYHQLWDGCEILGITDYDRVFSPPNNK